MPGYKRESSAHMSAGATLVELAVVLACTGILLTAAVPNFNHLRHQWNLWGGAHLLCSSLRQARAHAVSANTSLMLLVEEEGRRFCLMDGYTSERLEGTERYLPGGVRIVSSPRKPVRFYQRGNAVPAGTYIVQGETGSYRIVVNPGGRIRMSRE